MSGAKRGGCALALVLTACSGSSTKPDADAGGGVIDAGSSGDDGGGQADAAPPAAPVITEFVVEEIDPPLILKPTVVAHIEAADGDDVVVAACVTPRSDSPADDDACWMLLSLPFIGSAPGQNVAFDVPVPLGYLPGSKALRAWVRDQAGQVSAPVPSVSFLYDPGDPPQVTDVMATTSELPSWPPTAGDVTRSASDDDIFIRWNAVFPGGPAPGPVAIAYTIDGLNYVSVAQDLANAASDCSLGPSTGCFRWVGPKPAGYLGVRVVATDARGLVGTGTAFPIDSAPLWPLAGSTDSGVAGDARAALLNNQVTSLGSLDPGAIAISSRGAVYVRDRDRGILWVNPQNGVLETIARLDPGSGAPGGADGVVGVATVVAPGAIAIDEQDRLWLWDRERIRRIEVDADRNPIAVATVIGGGADLTSSGVAPDQVYVGFCQYCLLVPVAGGDLWFQPYYGATASQAPLRAYRAASGLVDAIAPGGNVDLPGIGVVDASSCQLAGLAATSDPVAGAITRLYVTTFGDCGWSMIELSPAGVAQRAAPAVPAPALAAQSLLRTGADGRIYLNAAGQVFALADDGASWQLAIGSGIEPSCADGAAPSACRVAAQDVAVDAFGRVHWVEIGSLRAVAGDGTVQTTLGRRLGSGDGEDALRVRLSRFAQARAWTDVGGGTRLVLADAVTQRYREAVVGGALTDLAGDGTFGVLPAQLPATARGAPVPISAYLMFDVDQLGNVYHPLDSGGGYNRVVRLVRGTPDEWEHLVGGGTESYATAPDGTDQSDVLLPNSLLYASVLGVTGTDVLLAFASYDPVSIYTDGMIERYPLGEPRVQTHIAGTTGPVSPWCADGTAAASCGLPITAYWSSAAAVHDDLASRWILPEAFYSGVLRTLPDDPAQPVGTLASLPFQFSSFTYRRDAGEEWIYLCKADDHRLYSYRIGDGLLEPLAWPVGNLRCEPATLRYLPDRNSLLFTYSQGGLFGLAEYVLP